MMTAMEPRRQGLRRSKLVAKGGTWESVSAAHASDADIVHIELEAGFSEEMRPSAVANARRALIELDWSGKEAWVRFRHIDTPATVDEIRTVLPGLPQLVYCAKVRSPADIVKLDRIISGLEAELGMIVGSTQIGAVIERVEALAQVEAIAAASPRMGAIMFGANDMSLDFGYRRTGVVGQDEETIFIRSRMVMAGRLAKIDIIDAAYMDRADLAAGASDAAFSARMGFTGKNALTAAQVTGIHQAFTPTIPEQAWAREVLAAAAQSDPALRLVDGDPVDPRDIRRAEVLIGRVLLPADNSSQCH
jgi:citrate lyase subunit beta/citryl-CoA lyase